MTGRCQCGNVCYAVTAAPYVSYTCHCRECQRLTSSAFTTCMQVPDEAVEVTQGEPVTRVRTPDSGNDLTTWFCAGCGSALFAQSVARPAIRTVFTGTLDAPEKVAVNAHIWIKRKLPWVVLPDGHRVFEAAGDWTPDYGDDILRYKPAPG